MRVTVSCSLAALGAFAAVAGGWPGRAGGADAEDPHAHCREAAEAAAFRRATLTTAEYQLPLVELVRDDGKTVPLAAEVDDGRPVVLNFIYTSCTTICPVMSQIFAGLQDRLGEDRARVHMVSISIDPEQDTPARLAEYGRRFHAGSQWRFYTGTVGASIAVQRAFNAWGGDKMRHTPLTLLRAAPGRPWVRVDGFASPEELARELHELVAAR